MDDLKLVILVILLLVVGAFIFATVLVLSGVYMEWLLSLVR